MFLQTWKNFMSKVVMRLDDHWNYMFDFRNSVNLDEWRGTFIIGAWHSVYSGGRCAMCDF